MRYTKQYAEILESDLSCMVMEFVEEHFSDAWCEDCPTYRNKACPEDFWSDHCPMYTQLSRMKDVADEFAHIIVEAFNR